MKSYRQWQTRRLVEQAIPLLKMTQDMIGNEAGEHVLTSPFSKKVDDFKDRITELPHPESKERKGLGDLGMSQVGKTTFKVVPAGENPTISHGVPVG